MQNFSSFDIPWRGYSYVIAKAMKLNHVALEQHTQQKEMVRFSEWNYTYFHRIETGGRTIEKSRWKKQRV